MEKDSEALIKLAIKWASVLLIACAGYLSSRCDNTKIPRNPVPEGVAERVETKSINKYEGKLRDAKTIIIKERTFNLGKDYKIIIGDEEVATVSGKDFRLIGGDLFALKTLDGKILASEREQNGFLQMDRAASVYDGDGELTGYIGEKGWSDFFSRGHIFHFYDKNKNEIGNSKRIGRTAMGKHKIYGLNGEIAYDIDKQFVLVGGDKYIITKVDDNAIPVEHAILITCIEDAIMDAEAKK